MMLVQRGLVTLTKIFNNKSNILFVSKADRIEERGSYTLILSPEFYWTKKVTLPVKKEKEALKLAPSVYEGFLPEGNFSYEVRKEGDDFIMIAYDKKKIASELEKVIPYKGDIAALYFAQDALGEVDECIAVNDKIALSNMDDVLMQIPRACTNTEVTLDEMLQNVTLTKHKVTLSSLDNELLSTRDIILVASLFGMLFLSFLSEYVVYKKATSALDTQRASIIKENDLPRTSVQLKSIKKSLVKKFDTQKNLREALFAISKISLKNGEYIESIEGSAKETVVKIHIQGKEREDEIRKMFPASVKIREMQVREDTLTVKVVSS